MHASLEFADIAADQLAARDARGPGSFAGAIVDALYRLDRGTLRAGVRIG
jgi:hydroxyethylthiazole kinase-like sugar kinase family protein